MIGVEYKGRFNNLRKFLEEMQTKDAYLNLHKYGKLGVDALAQATPVDSGLTARSWGYRIVEMDVGPSIEWYNTNVNDGVNVAILIQYGHGTGTGGYVQGIDYINPAIRPIFEQASKEVWKEVTQ